MLYCLYAGGTTYMNKIESLWQLPPDAALRAKVQSWAKWRATDPQRSEGDLKGSENESEADDDAVAEER
jgi:hypothetical protein